jgi:MFS family permease
VGTNGLIYTYCVLAADVTDLRNRGLAFAFTSSPYMITAFAGSKAAEGFLLHVNWRWGFGAFAIIFPCVCAPLFTLLKYNEHKARKQGLLVREKSGPVTINKIWRGIVDFDRKYIFLLVALHVLMMCTSTRCHSVRRWSDCILASIQSSSIFLQRMED